MSLERQKKLVEEAGELGLGIPGLSLDPIINNIVDKSEEIKTQKEIIEEERDELIERGENAEEAKKTAQEKIKEIVKIYIAAIKEAILEQIAIIKQAYKKLSDDLKSIPDDIKSIIANILLPPAISVPPAAPNPIYAVNLAKTAKNNLNSVLNAIIISFTEMLKAANKILFALPESILTLFEQIKTTSQVINTIPV
jgi:DNA repair exonuclease SbcCD ATPase subunit